MKYESELIKEIVDTKGHEKSLLHYESECVEAWIDEAKGAYPKLNDYRGEWLNYIAENPIGKFPYITLSDVTDATVDNVVPYAYKSAILKGQTLVNVVKQSDFSPRYCKATETNNGYIYTQTESQLATRIEFDYSSTSSLIKNDTYYLVSFKFKNNKQRTVNIQTDGAGCVSYGNTFSENTHIHIKGKIKTASSDGTKFRIYVKCDEDIDYTDDTFEITELMLIEYQEGMENWDIPYFEGMQSVKMPVLTTTGKNLFDINKCISGKIIDDNGELIDGSSHIYATEEFIKIDNTITISIISEDDGVPDTANGTKLRFYDKNKKLISSDWLAGGMQVQENRKKRTFTINGAEYLRLNISASGGGADTSYEAMKTIQIENGSSMTSYEPHKTNILSTPQDLVLGGIGDVQDTLDLLTGEVELATVERGLSTLSNLNWLVFGSGTPNAYYTCVINDAKDGSKIISDSLVSTQIFTTNTEYGVYFSGNSIRLRNDEATTGMSVDDFKNSLSSSTNKIRYVLAEKVVKTVDLLITNQDGNTLSKIKPIEGTMHLATSSDTLKPTFSGEIPVEATTQNLASFIEE